MTKPVAVIINDVHYNINTLEVADKAMRQAINCANDLGVTLVVAGDLHDTKANIRGECVNAMQKTFALANTAVFILRGNHDALNEKSSEHSLGFLSAYADIVTAPRKLSDLEAMFGDPGILIPYHHDPEELKAYLKTLPKGSRLIMHQGVLSSKAGHYIQDKSALSTECFADFRVISGHYHERQDIKCGRPRKGHVGLFTYTGNPYTLTFAEANEEKGFHVLYDDGSLEFKPTNLRKHVTAEIAFEQLDEWIGKMVNNHIKPNDILWVKIIGTREQLSTLNKVKVTSTLGLKQDYRLEFLPQTPVSEIGDIDIKSISAQPELLDDLIGSLTNVSDEQKKRLQSIWKDLVE